MRLTPAFLCLAMTLFGPIAVDGAPLSIRRANPDAADVNFGQQKNLADVDVSSLRNPHVDADINPCKQNLFGLVGPECQQQQQQKKKKKAGRHNGVVVVGDKAASQAFKGGASVNPGRGLSVQPSEFVQVGGHHPTSSGASKGHGGERPHHSKQDHQDPTQQGNNERRPHSGDRGHGQAGRGGFHGDRGQRHQGGTHKTGSESSPKKDRAGQDQHTGGVEISRDHVHPSLLLDLDADKILPLNALNSGATIGTQAVSAKTHSFKQAAEPKKVYVQNVPSEAKAASDAVVHKASNAQHNVANGGKIDCSSHGGLFALTSLNIDSCNGASGGVNDGDKNTVAGSIHKGNTGLLNALHRRQEGVEGGDPQDDGAAAATPSEEPAADDGEAAASSTEEPATDDGAGYADSEGGDTDQDEGDRLFWPRSGLGSDFHHERVGLHPSKVTHGLAARDFTPVEANQYLDFIEGLVSADGAFAAADDKANTVAKSASEDSAKKSVLLARSAKLRGGPITLNIPLVGSVLRRSDPSEVTKEESEASSEDEGLNPGLIDASKSHLPASTADEKAGIIKDAITSKATSVKSKSSDVPVSTQNLVDPAEKASMAKDTITSKASSVKSAAPEAPVSPQNATETALKAIGQSNEPASRVNEVASKDALPTTPQHILPRAAKIRPSTRYQHLAAMFTGVRNHVQSEKSHA